MSDRGLGTPATWASIIDGLLKEGYLRREGRDLIPTAKARQLLTLLNGLGVSELTSPGLTGDWESRLKPIGMGQLERTDFLPQIEHTTKVLVGRLKEYESD